MGQPGREAMLVLRRKVGERIIIGDSIEVTILKVQGGKVRLGFTAPRNVRVNRKEAVGRENRDAAEDAERTLDPIVR
jgi:carbon storage regulator